MLFLAFLLFKARVKSDYYLVSCPKSVSNVFNLCFYDNGKFIKTTYGGNNGNGYGVVLRVNSIEKDLNSTSITYDNIKVNTLMINLSGQVGISHVLQNNGLTTKTVSIAVHADTQVYDNDLVPIYRVDPMRGFRMTHKNYSIYLLFKQQYANRPAVDSLWYGIYSNRKNNLWKNATNSSFTTGDSGLAYSWQNYTLKPGEKVNFTTGFTTDPNFDFNIIPSYIPTEPFTPSSVFTPSKKFTASDVFSKSEIFSKTDEFSKSEEFEDSEKFTRSGEFSESAVFSKSRVFSKSEDFTKSDAFSKSQSFSLSNNIVNENSEFGLLSISGVSAGNSEFDFSQTTFSNENSNFDFSQTTFSNENSNFDFSQTTFSNENSKFDFSQTTFSNENSKFDFSQTTFSNENSQNEFYSKSEFTKEYSIQQTVTNTKELLIFPNTQIPDKKGGSNTVMIIGIVCGVVAAILIASVVAFIVIRKRKQSIGEKSSKNQSSIETRSMKQNSEQSLDGDEDRDLDFWL